MPKIQNNHHLIYRYNILILIIIIWKCRALRDINNSPTIEEINKQYFRPSPLPALNTRNFDYNFFDKYSNEDLNKIVLPDSLFNSPENTIINYFSILREAENISKGGCGTIGNARIPYPISYKFLTSEYQNRIDYKTYFDSFKDIGHINLVKLNNITDENTPKGTYKFFYELEAIEPSTNGNISFSYYHGFITVVNENGKYKTSDIEINQFIKDNNKWKPIKRDVNKCIKRYRLSYMKTPPYFSFPFNYR